MNPSATVAVTGLTVRHRRTVALDALDLSLGPGVHGLLGPNGAGKTSLIRVLATVAAPSSGRVELLGTDSAGHGERTAIRRRLGYLPQEFGYYPAFTVREFVAYVAEPAMRLPALDYTLDETRTVLRRYQGTPDSVAV
ncbi:ATP-binding cassette domain-containing protein, partial [Streptomyces tanashiensis]